MDGDRELIQIVDAALAEAARKAGPWLKCRIGCTECCIGPFAITRRDAERLCRGLMELPAERAQEIRERARRSAERLRSGYPGDTLARVIEDDEAGAGEPCPALHPETGACELYAARPMTCRTFGPPLRIENEALAVCELCFDGAAPEEIAACEVVIDPRLRDEIEGGETIIAFVLAQ